MHICLVTQEFPPETNWGGIATYSSTLAESLVQLGHQVSVIALSTKGQEYKNEQGGISIYRIMPAWAKYFSRPGFRHIYKYYSAYHWTVFKQLRRLHGQNPIDIIETPNLHGEALFWQLWGPRVPVIVRLHSSSRQNRILNGGQNNLAARIDFWHEKMALRNASGISAVSECIVKYNGHIIPKEVPLRIIGNPFDIKLLPPVQLEKDAPAIILYASRLSQSKGFPTLVKAIPLILEKNPHVKFVIAGKDGVSPTGGSMQVWAEKELANYDDRIDFKGMLNRAEILDLFKTATVAVFPTQFESFGYISLEAMAFGAILVASNLDGPAEVVQHNQTGLLFEPNNAVDLAYMVNRVLSKDFPRKKMQETAWRHVQTHFSQSVIVGKTLAFYQEIMDR